jgi:hypothetical protein
MNSRSKANKKKQQIKGYLDQLEDWKRENCIGFDLWTMRNEEKGFTLIQVQTKHGIAIIQVIDKDESFVVYTHKASY